MSRASEAMRAVDRRRFLPADQQRHAAVDAPLSIGYGVTNSQPTTVRVMLDLLDPQPGDRVLDVGAGSGWTTALLAWLVGETGAVVGVERVPELVTFARERVLPDDDDDDATEAGASRPARPLVELHEADPQRFGWPTGAPYDRILVSAEAEQVPGELVDQLAADGVMVLPVAGEMLRVVRGPEGPVVTRHGGFRFVPLLR